jgi:hypothetical protein
MLGAFFLPIRLGKGEYGSIAGKRLKPKPEEARPVYAASRKPAVPTLLGLLDAKLVH